MNNSLVIDDLVSIIVPVFNVEPYLNNCLESIASQSFKNLEIILVDDGSTDRSGDICDSFAQNDRRFIVIHQDNHGLSHARNQGLRLAHGSYISFVDSDDYIHPQMIEILLNKLRSCGCRLCVCGRRIQDENGNTVFEDTIPEIGNTIQARDVLNKRMINNELGFWCVVWNKLFDRGLFDDVEFPVGYVAEDYYVLSLIYRKCDRVATTSEKLYYYRAYRPGSLTSLTTRKLLDEMIISLKLASFFAPDKDYSIFTKQMIDNGLENYKGFFWFSRNKHDSFSSYIRQRKKEFIPLYRQTWRDYRKVAKMNARDYLYYEIHYININLVKKWHRLFHRELFK